MKELDKKADEAIWLHQQLLYDKTMELVLGEMVRTLGVKQTRAKLKVWLNHLGEFEN